MAHTIVTVDNGKLFDSELKRYDRSYRDGIGCRCKGRVPATTGATGGIMFAKSMIYGIATAVAMAGTLAASVAPVGAQQLEVWALSGPEGNYFEQALKRF